MSSVPIAASDLPAPAAKSGPFERMALTVLVWAGMFLAALLGAPVASLISPEMSADPALYDLWLSGLNLWALILPLLVLGALFVRD